MPSSEHLSLRHAIARESRTWLNTPYQHQGRIKTNRHFKGGVDCGGLIIAIGNRFKLWQTHPFDYHTYPEAIPEDLLLNLFNRYLVQKPIADGGDILLLLVGGKIQHAGIFTFNNTLIHTCNRAGKVIETDCTPHTGSVIGVYQYPFFADT